MNIIPASQAILCLKKQKAHKTETQTQNNLTKNVHFVVKNSPFVLNFSVNKDCSSASSKKLIKKLSVQNFKVGLMYDDWDHELLRKEVDYVKSEPFTYKIKMDPTGKRIDITVRIKVLTSQLEDMLFRIGVGIVGEHEDPEDAEYQYFSHPIRVISKVKKQSTPNPAPPKKTSKRRASQTSAQKYVEEDDLDSPPSETTDAWEDLVNFESNHEYQTLLLQSLQSKLLENEQLSQMNAERKAFSEHTASSSPAQPLEASSSPPLSTTKTCKRHKEPATEFQKAFKFLMGAYTKIPETQKTPRVQSLVKQHAHAPCLQEMMDMLRDQTQQRDQFSSSSFFQPEDPIFRQPQKKFHTESIPLSRSEEDLSLGLTSFSTPITVPSTFSSSSSASSSSIPSLVTECCHKQELNRIEAFYESVFTNGF